MWRAIHHLTGVDLPLAQLPMLNSLGRISTIAVRAWAQALAMTALMLTAPALHAQDPPLKAGSDSAEARFERVLRGMTGGRLPAALDEMRRLAELYPNWRLAHLVHGDLLLARGAPIARFGNTAYVSGIAGKSRHARPSAWRIFASKRWRGCAPRATRRVPAQFPATFCSSTAGNAMRSWWTPVVRAFMSTRTPAARRG